MRRFLSILALSACALTMQPVVASADDGIEDCHTTIVGSAMSPTDVVVGLVAKSSLFTVTLDNTCDNPVVEVNLAGAEVPVGLHVEMGVAVPHGSGLYTFAGTASWSAADLTDDDAAGDWISYIDASSDNGPSVSGYGVSFNLLRAATVGMRSVPDSVKKGAVLNVSGSLTQADWATGRFAGYGGQRVELQHKDVGGSYTTVRTSRSMSNGAVWNVVRADEDGCYRLVFHGNATTGAVTGAAECVVVG